MAGERIEIQVSTDAAKASEEIAELAAKLEALTGISPTVTVEADAADAAGEVAAVGTEVDDLDGSGADVAVQADAADAAGEIEAVASSLDEVDGTAAEVAVEADATDAADDIADVASAVEDVDGASAEVAVEVDSEGAIDALDDVASAADDTASALDDVAEADLGSVKGPLKDLLRPLDLARSQFGDLADVIQLTGDKAVSALSPKVAQAFTSAIPYAGAAIGAAASVWQMFSQQAERAREATEEVVDASKGVMEAFKAGEFDKAAEELVTANEDVLDSFHELGIGSEEALRFITGVSDELPTAGFELDHLGESTESAAIRLQNFGDMGYGAAKTLLRAREGFIGSRLAVDQHAARVEAAAEALQLYGGMTDEAATATAEFGESLSELRGLLDLEDAALNAAEAIDKLDDKYLEAVAAEAEFGKGSEEASDAQRDLAQEVNSTKDDLLTYMETIEDIPLAKKTEILAAIERGDLKTAIRLLDEAAKPGGKPRAAPVKAEPVNTGPTGRQLDNTAQPGGKGRSAPMIADAVNTGPTEGELDRAARFRNPRPAPIHAHPTNVGPTDRQLDDIANQTRNAWITVNWKQGTRAPGPGGRPGPPVTLAAPAGLAAAPTAAAGSFPLYGPPTVQIHVDARGAIDPYSVGRAVTAAANRWGRISAGWRPGVLHREAI
jgi:hypothetical protein